MKKVAILLGLLLLSTLPSSAAISVSQSKSHRETPAANTNAIAFDSNTTAGTMLFISCAFPFPGNGITISDTLSNTWLTVRNNNPQDHDTQFDFFAFAFYVQSNASSGADTVTMTFTASHSAESTCGIMEIAGLNTATFDQTAFANNSSTNTSLDSGNTSTTAAANEILIGWGSTGLAAQTYTAGSGWTIAQQNFNYLLEYKIVSATGTYNATATVPTADFWEIAIATFSGTAAAAKPTRPRSSVI